MTHAHEPHRPEQAEELKLYREPAAGDDAGDALGHQEDAQDPTAEEYWAGRNPAMRQSARLAA